MTKPLRVMIVDDYEPFRNLLNRLLTRYDDLVVVGVAETGEEALDFASELAPEVVVMDSAMPGMGGVEATRRMVDVLPHVYVIGHSGHDNAATMRAAGAAAFVQKGAPPSALLEAIRAGRCRTSTG
jgi:two-component system, NarL family, invasion response regulator UvrY